MIKSLLIISFFFNLFLHCGYHKLLSTPISLSQDKIISLIQKIPENFQNSVSQLTLFGSLSFQNLSPKEHPIFKLKSFALKNQPQTPQLDNIILIDYNNINIPFIHISIASQTNQRTETQKQFTIEINKEYLISISFDFSQNKFLFVISSLEEQDKNILIQINSNFSQFRFQEQFEISLGCFVDNFATSLFPLDQLLQTCSFVNLNNFSFIFEYFEQYQLFPYFSTNFQSSLDQMKNLKEIFSDKNNFKYFIEGQPILKENFFQGNGQINYLRNGFFQEERFSSPTIFISFVYKEPLNDSFTLIQQNENKQEKLKIILNRKQLGREIQIKFGIVEQIFIGEIQENQKIDLLLIFLQTQKNSSVLSFLNGKAIQSQNFNQKFIFNQNLELFDKDEKFSGSIDLLQFNIMSNGTGPLTGLLSSSNRCKENCLLFHTFQFQNQKCLNCQINFVLNENFQCTKFCEKGFQNKNGKCFKCPEEFCQNLNQNYFTIEKQLDENFLVKQIKNLPSNQNIQFDKFLQIEISDAIKGKDFDYEIIQKINEKQALIKYQPKFKEKFQSKIMTFYLREDSSLTDENQNLIQQRVNYQLFERGIKLLGNEEKGEIVVKFGKFLFPVFHLIFLFNQFLQQYEQNNRNSKIQ